jgi:outer membrane lipoprotein-sorting protein
MMRITLTIFLAIAFACATSHAADKPTTRPQDPQLLKQLEDLDARAAKIKDFTAEFTQEKFTALLKKPVVSSGVVRVAGSTIRWDTKKPSPAVLYSDGQEVRMYYPDQKLLEIYAIDQRLGELAASPLPRLKTLREHFSVERTNGKSFKPPKDRDVLALKLMPVEESLREHLDHVAVLLDVKSAHILEMEMVDADGDRTHVSVSNVRLDTDLKPADLKLNVPDDTTTSRPLDVKDERR